MAYTLPVSGKIFGCFLIRYYSKMAYPKMAHPKNALYLTLNIWMFPYPVIFQSFSLDYMRIGEFRFLAEASADVCILCSYFPLKSCSSRRVVSGVKVEVVGAMTSPSNKSEMPGTVRVDWNDAWICLHVPYVSICPSDGYIIPSS